jgi:hypothetical protein
MNKKLLILFLWFLVAHALYAQHSFRIRAITAGVNLNSLNDTATFNNAIKFLEKARQIYIDNGYEIQTIRISTQNLYKYLNQHTYDEALPYLVQLDKIAQKNKYPYQ